MTGTTTCQISRDAYDAVQSVVDGVDEAARLYETKWGVGRLELLVSDELREKFRKQLRRFNEAIEAHDVERVRQSGGAMRRAWEALDQAAIQAGAVILDPDVWEIGLPDGKVVAFCRSRAEAFAVWHAGRYVDVWTVEEIAQLIVSFPQIALAKVTFPGAYVESARAKPASEPLEEEVAWLDESAKEDA